MKHLLNNISQEEKNNIREQHSGGKEIMIENFNQMINKKLGDVPTYLTEQSKETCEQCGSEMREGECMEQCGSEMREGDMVEQSDKKVVTITPDQMKMLHDKGECDCGDVKLKFPSYK